MSHTYEYVPVAEWANAAASAHARGYTYFCFLSGIDWLPNPDLDGEKVFDPERSPSEPQEVITDPEIRHGGGRSRFQVIGHLQNVTTHTELTLTADVHDDLEVPTWTGAFSGADWHERETWEMFGFVFVGHPGLRHIYLPEEFEGHPLRKDYPLLARMVRPWPGLVDMEEMPPRETAEENAPGGAP